MSRRLEAYKEFVRHTDELMGEWITQFRVFVNDPETLTGYKELERDVPKIKLFQAPPDFVFKHGHDTVYNFLEKNVESTYILKLFDTDIVYVDHDVFAKELGEGPDIVGMNTYMQRGNVWEWKYQMYKPNLMKWFGLVHENQVWNSKDLKMIQSEGLKVEHMNALDPESRELEKTPDGQFIILKKTEEGTDSDKRNMLYETLTWKIVHEGGRQQNAAWFHKHYEINREVVDWYYQRAKQKFNL